MTKKERLFKLFLRIIGSTALVALVAVIMPYSYMNTIHQRLGMGQLPAEPIVGYLARSTSAFYALFGGLLWIVSTDLRRHRLVLCYLGAATVVFGVMLFVVDFLEGMPLFWRFCEGPIVVIFGAIILVLVYHIAGENEQTQ
jgi:ATP/ADP translocase